MFLISCRFYYIFLLSLWWCVPSHLKHVETLFLYLSTHPQLTHRFRSTLSVLILYISSKVIQSLRSQTTAHNAILRMEERTMPVCGACRCIYFYYSNLHPVLLLARKFTYPDGVQFVQPPDCRSTPCFPCAVIGVMPRHEKFPFLLGFRNNISIIHLLSSPVRLKLVRNSQLTVTWSSRLPGMYWVYYTFIYTW